MGHGCGGSRFDNDGLPDIYVTGYNGNVLYHNLGDCKFEDVTEKAGVAGGGFSTGAAWADYDRDGHVDLFVSRYVHFDMNKLPTFGSDEKTCRFKGVRVQCGPWGLQGESDLLYHNRGDGTFEEVSKKAGVDDPNHYYGLGVVWGDYDNDGWPDLYVANDSGPNFLYHNKHDGTFEDVGMLAGAALSGEGLEQGSMGVDWGDYLHEGRLSMFVTNFTEQPDTLYRNMGPDGFSDVSWPAKLAKSTSRARRVGNRLFLTSTMTAGLIFSWRMDTCIPRWIKSLGPAATLNQCCCSATNMMEHTKIFPAFSLLFRMLPAVVLLLAI